MRTHLTSSLLPSFAFLAAAALPAQAPGAKPGPDAASADSAATGQRGNLQVHVDPRVELLSLVFRLAGNPEYNQARIEGYAKDADEHFAAHREHAVVKLARRLRQQHGVSFDAVMSLAIHLDGVPSLTPLVPLDPIPADLDRRWPAKDTATFVAELRRFVKDADMAGFLAAHKDLYQKAETRMQKVLAEHAKLDWFDGFFGVRAQADFELALGLLNGGGCYGPRVRLASGREQLYCVLGVWQSDKEGDPSFDADVVATVVHEFCHSYANPLVEKHEAAFAKAGAILHPRVAKAMERQAYGNWHTVMCESMVRACVVRYQAANGGDKARRKQIEEELGNSFLWIEGLSDVLGEYEKGRDRHPTLDSFMPKVAAFFDQYAAKAAATPVPVPPRVVSMTPKNGATNVDPDLTEIKVTFDQPMKDKSWAVVGGGPHFPETTGKPSYDAARKVLTIPVRLKPDWDYELWLNRGKFSSFMNDDGVKLEPVKVTFKTRAAKK